MSSIYSLSSRFYKIDFGLPYKIINISHTQTNKRTYTNVNLSQNSELNLSLAGTFDNIDDIIIMADVTGVTGVTGVTRFFDVKARDAGFVIGTGGQTIKRIEHKTQTHIEFEKRAPPFSPRFRVEGPEWRVNDAIEKIRFVAIEAEKKNSLPLHAPRDGLTTSVTINNADIGFVIGVKGKTINMIGQKTGCRVWSVRGSSSENTATVNIAGPNVDAIEKAKAFVFKVANEAIDRRRTNKAIAASSLSNPKSEIERKFPVNEHLLPTGAMTTGLLVHDSKTGKLTKAIYDPVKECFVTTPIDDAVAPPVSSDFPPLSGDTTSAAVAAVREPQPSQASSCCRTPAPYFRFSLRPTFSEVASNKKVPPQPEPKPEPKPESYLDFLRDCETVHYTDEDLEKGKRLPGGCSTCGAHPDNLFVEFQACQCLPCAKCGVLVYEEDTLTPWNCKCGSKTV